MSALFKLKSRTQALTQSAVSTVSGTTEVEVSEFYVGMGGKGEVLPELSANAEDSYLAADGNDKRDGQWAAITEWTACTTSCGGGS